MVLSPESAMQVIREMTKQLGELHANVILQQVRAETAEAELAALKAKVEAQKETT